MKNNEFMSLFESIDADSERIQKKTQKIIETINSVIDEETGFGEGDFDIKVMEREVTLLSGFGIIEMDELDELTEALKTLDLSLSAIWIEEYHEIHRLVFHFILRRAE